MEAHEKRDGRTRTEREVRELFVDAWEDAAKGFDGIEDPAESLELAADLHRIDPEQFSQAVRITPERWESYRKLVEQRIGRPLDFVHFAARIRHIDLGQFNRIVTPLLI
jgi:hypothetical protein